VDNTFTIYGNFQRQVYDITDPTQEIDLPMEWFVTIKYLLSCALADEYEVPESRCKRLMQMAQYYQGQLEQWQKVQDNVKFAEQRQQQEKVNLNERPQ
jgi:hypothetical protein